MRMAILVAAAALVATYAFPVLAEGGCGWSDAKTTASDTSTKTTVTADSGLKQSKPADAKN